MGKRAIRQEAADRILDIAYEIEDLVHEARRLAYRAAPERIDNWDAYVFKQIQENVRKNNKYNIDLQDVAEYLSNEGNDQ
jgi:hypothetical protein